MSRAVEPEPKQFWMPGAGARNLSSGSTALLMRHSSHYFSQNPACLNEKDNSDTGRQCQSFLCTDYCNVSAYVRQNKEIIATLQMPSS